MSDAANLSTEVADLLQRLDQGDKDAIWLLIERCRRQFRLRAAQMLGNFSRLRNDLDTSDVEQELHVRLAGVLGAVKVQGKRHLLGLANQTLRRFLIDWTRRKRPRESINGVDPSDSDVDPTRALVLEEIQTWVGTLSDERQEVFDLLFYQEFTHQAASEILGVSRIQVTRTLRGIKLEFIEKFGSEFSDFFQ
jgi:RNA polymerase sigma factor (sigma-70 family)